MKYTIPRDLKYGETSLFKINLSHCRICAKQLKNKSRVFVDNGCCICMKCFKKIGGDKNIQNLWEGNCIFLVKDIKEKMRNENRNKI